MPTLTPVQHPVLTMSTITTTITITTTTITTTQVSYIQFQNNLFM